MPFLDMIEDDKDLLWGNNANELNASYAADGYARIKGAGCIVTTFGVGELSAASGIAGSYAEMIPVIHIAGTPNTQSQAKGALLHHSLGNGNFQVFQEFFAKICTAAEHLTKNDAIKQIDHVFRESLINKRPGYIGLPIDLINHSVNVLELSPLDLTIPRNPPNVQNVAIQVISDAIRAAHHPIIIVDACVQRFGLEKEAIALIERSGFPTYVSPMAKGVVPDSLVNYRGCYGGGMTLKGVVKEVEQADLVIELGSIKSDINTGIFTYAIDQAKTISLQLSTTIVFFAEYDEVRMAELLPLLTQSLPAKPRVFNLGPRHVNDPIIDGSQEITQHYFWNKVPEYMVPNSIIVAEMGCSEFGSFNMRAPEGSTFVSQVLWGSIGYSVGATLGAAAAARDRQVYLFCGDGSFQLTAQEISVMLHQGFTPVVFVLNNDGYLIEKMIHGPHRKYNNFQMWQYSKTLDYFGCRIQRNLDDVSPAPVGVEAKVSTREEFAAMKKIVAAPRKIHFLEVVLPQFDAPWELEITIQNMKEGACK